MEAFSKLYKWNARNEIFIKLYKLFTKTVALSNYTNDMQEMELWVNYANVKWYLINKIKDKKI